MTRSRDGLSDGDRFIMKQMARARADELDLIIKQAERFYEIEHPDFIDTFKEFIKAMKSYREDHFRNVDYD